MKSNMTSWFEDRKCLIKIISTSFTGHIPTDFSADSRPDRNQLVLQLISKPDFGLFFWKTKVCFYGDFTICSPSRPLIISSYFYRPKILFQKPHLIVKSIKTFLYPKKSHRHERIALTPSTF